MLKRVGPHDIQVRTFHSKIDGSIQPYAVLPAANAPPAGAAAQPPDAHKPGMGLIVTLHDAGSSCEQYIAQCTPKTWAHVLAPQGRRSFGFDWEAWSEEDVFEALADAREHYSFDPHRTYLTGHSMGGHGVWHIGVTRPDQFAAIGPCSGWISYWSYGGGMPSMETPSNVDALMLRGYNESDTLKLLTNLANTGVYVLHGARRSNRAGRPSPPHAHPAGGVPLEFRLLRAAGRRSLVGQRVLRLAADDGVLSPANSPRRRRSNIDRFHHCQSSRIVVVRLGKHRSPTRTARAEPRRHPAKYANPHVRGQHLQRRPASDRCQPPWPRPAD